MADLQFRKTTQKKKRVARKWAITKACVIPKQPSRSAADQFTVTANQTIPSWLLDKVTANQLASWFMTDKRYSFMK